jgi:hypothetical protein
MQRRTQQYAKLNDTAEDYAPPPASEYASGSILISRLLTMTKKVFMNDRHQPSSF